MAMRTFFRKKNLSWWYYGSKIVNISNQTVQSGKQTQKP